MKHRWLLILICTVLFIAACNLTTDNRETGGQWVQNIQPPAVERMTKAFDLHGDKRTDDYYWLNQRENPKVLQYLQEENAYFDTMMSATKPLQAKLFKEMKARIKEKDESVPYKENGYWYYTRFEENKQYGVYCRKKETMKAPEEILLNENEMAEHFSYYDIGGLQVSDNNAILAYTVDSVSRRLYGLRFMQLKTGMVYPEEIADVDGNDIAWAADNKTVFYIKKDTVTLLGYQVWRHILGTDPGLDVLAYQEPDNRFYLSLQRSKSKKYISIVSDKNQVSTECRLLKANDPAGEFKVFQPRQENMEYTVEHSNDKFYIYTNWNASNYRIMETPEAKTAKENWKEIIPHRAEVYLAGFNIFNNYLVLAEEKDALSRIRVIKLSGNEDYYLSFEEPAYSINIDNNSDYHNNVLRYQYNSLTTPPVVYDYNLGSRQKQLKKQTEILGGFKKENYTTERLWATSRDGVKIPISIVYKKGYKKDGNSPLLLYGYGSYGFSSFADFSSNIISLLDRGFAYAIAHIRGGQEMGRQWYENGHMLNKKNTFFDFIDCGEFLVKQKFTSTHHLYANGASAGGLLMGAIVNMRPDLWNGVIAQVPFVDVITTMSDSTIPLTTGEYKEWGNPADSAEYFYMKSYSPYDNVKPQAYPNLLVTTGLHDSQVQYFEPAKWVAKLRSVKTDKNILLFMTDMNAGHGGASGRFDSIEEEAVQYSFLLALERIRE